MDLAHLDSLDAAAARIIRERCVLVRLEAGERAFRAGDACANYLLVTAGSVRIQMIAESGREIVLYRVRPGDSCVLTTSCLFGHETYSAEGICETSVTAVAIPEPVFRTLLGASESFRDLILADYARRVGDILLMLDSAASHGLAERLAGLILDRADAAGRIAATHQDLAAELGTAREVVSRHLKDLERRGILELSRGAVTIVDRSALSRMRPV